MSEVFYPDLSTPSVRSLELVVTDGETFTDRDVAGHRHDGRAARPAQPAVHPDQPRPRRALRAHRAVRHLAAPRQRRRAGAAHLARRRSLPALRAPRPGADQRRHGRPRRAGGPAGCWRTTGRWRRYLVARPGFGARASGLVGTATSPWRDLRERPRPRPAPHAPPAPATSSSWAGSPASPAAREPGRRRSPSGSDARRRPRCGRHAAPRAERAGAAPARRTTTGWHGYLDGLNPVPASAAASGTSTSPRRWSSRPPRTSCNRGAIVASPSAPWVWGDEIEDLSSPSGAYHLVWSRDSYQFGTALWAMGDRAAARRSVDWLFGVQQLPDGSFPQNSDVAAPRSGSELQLDEVALPDRAGRTGRQGRRPHLARGAQGRRVPRRLPRRGDRPPGAVLAAGAVGEPVRLLAQLDRGPDLRARGRRRHGARAGPAGRSPQPWLAGADRWQRKVEDWTVTTTGPLSDEPYFLRLTKNGRPGHRQPLRRWATAARSRSTSASVVDPSFLDLVRYGITAPDDPAVLSTLPVVDERAAVLDAERPVLAPLQLRRVRRDPRRRAVGRSPTPATYDDARPRLAAADRRARRVRRHGRRGRGAVPRRPWRPRPEPAT